jgi:hypothetical protein
LKNDEFHRYATVIKEAENELLQGKISGHEAAQIIMNKIFV